MENSMDNNIPSHVSQASDYIDLIKNGWPLIAACFMASFLWGLKKIKNGYKLQNKVAIFGNLIFTSLGAMVMGFSCVLLLPQIYPDVTPNIELGVAIMVSIMGQKLFDIYLMKYFGLKTVDLQDQDDVDHIQGHFNERDKNVGSTPCPFKEDGGMCDKCESCQNAKGSKEEDA